MKTELRLPGLRTDPIASYLSAIGVLRIVGTQADPGAAGWWHVDEFRLSTRLTREELVSFFVSDYSPTPVMTPWSGGSGFFPKDNKANIRTIEASTDMRLARYRESIERAKSVLQQLSITDKLDKPTKLALLQACRAQLPDDALDWLDAAFTLTDTDVSFPPLLGTGGNDGRLDFAQNFMANIAKLVLEPGSNERARSWLEDALSGVSDRPLADSAVGQFHPGGVGGPNATSGFEGASLVNPWTYVLMIEGAIAWAGTVSRRMGTSASGRAAFPFTVTASAAGWPTLAGKDDASARAEMWLPVWSNPASCSEVLHLLSEGRATVGRRQARTGVDFALAASQLGVDRGIRSFHRYTFVRRSGLAYLAAPAGSITVKERPSSSLINQATLWIDAARRLAESTDAGSSLRSAVRRLDDAVMSFCSFGGKPRLAEVLISVGRLERLLSRLATSKLNEKIPPLQGISTRWLQESYDGSAEFRLAAAAASICDEHAGPIRMQLEPITERRDSRLKWADRTSALAVDAADPAKLFAALLLRRLVETSGVSSAACPTSGLVNATLGDIDRLIRGSVDSQRLTHLFWAMCTLAWPKASPTCPWRSEYGEPPPDISRVYCMLKLTMLPRPIEWPKGSKPIPVRAETAIVARLRGGGINSAVSLAGRRLRASGFSPMMPEDMLSRDAMVFPVSDRQARGIAGALLLPISEKDVRQYLCEFVLHRPASQVANQ